MKDKKRKTKTIESELEKTAFEKFEAEVKGTIFNVLYVLLKDDETSHWKHIILIFLDYIQMYYFPFAEITHYPWKSDSVLHYWQTFLSFFQLTYWLGKLDLTTYIVIFYICIFIVCLVILDIFYVSYSFSRKKFSFVWPLQALRSICGLFVTVLFLPFLETFTSMIDCHSHDGAYSNLLFPEFHCWTGQHIIHATFALVVSLIFIFISVVVALTYFDSQSTSHDISAKVNSRADVFFIAMKIILIYVYAFLGKPQYHWLLIILLLLLSYIGYYNYSQKWPYFNDKMNKYFCVLNGIFLWSNFVLFIAKILEHSDFSGALQLYFLGLPLIFGAIIFAKDERMKLLLQNINNFQKGDEVALQIRYFLHLVQTKDHDRKNAIILKGYIYHHEDSCPNNDCQLKQYKNGMLTSQKNKKGTKKHSQLAQNFDNYQLLLQHAKNMYRQGIQKFPTCTSLKIQYGFFLMERLNKKSEAIQELIQAQDFNPPFDEQFVIYRYQKISEDFGDAPGEGHGGLDVVSKFAYDSSLRQLQQHIERSAQLHLEFWNYLRDDRPDIAKLNECGSKINQSIVMVEQYWAQLQKLNSNVPKALKIYAKFLIEILNDKEAGQDLLSRAKDATNVKQNYYDGNNINDDLTDISQMSSNGTPCIYVSGDNDKIGMVIQCNMGACRIFGYTASEIKNHNVEKLMPEMYAKNHSKVLDEALSKGAENIPNKERMVFARHKSGYVFPVWLQLKMVQNIQNGAQFVALFKIDKKIISSNIGYVLLNREKKIQGISSSCIKLMNLDLPKLRRMAQSGIDISKLAPALFDEEHKEYAFSQKQGGVLEWYLAEAEKTKRKQNEKVKTIGLESSNNTGTFIQEAQETRNKMIITNQKIAFTCHLNTITMANEGEIGWYLKLEPVPDKVKSQAHSRDKGKESKEKEKIRQPLFQFRYESEIGKYLREIKDNIHTDNAGKDPNFKNGAWALAGLTGQTPGGGNSNDQDKGGNGLQGNSSEDEKSEADLEEVKITMKAEDNDKGEVSSDLFDRKRKWARGIQIYRLVGGKFQTKDQEEELKRQQQIEEERKKKNEEEEKNNQSTDVFKNNIKSRKALQMAINDKSVPKAIRNLSWTMNIVILCLLGLAISEFTIISAQFRDINENFNLIKYSFGIIAEIQRIAYNVRSLILINEGLFVTYKNYTTEPDFIEFMQSDITDALDSLYSLQNNISLSGLSLSDEHQVLMDNKTVKLYFKQQDNSLKILNFSLTEAVLQISSAIFTINHFNISNFTEMQEDVYFITYNVYNDFLIALRTSSGMYVSELYSRSKTKINLILILFLSSIGTLLFTMTILFPVVSSVNFARMKVLSLFVDIPNFHVIALANKCEKFLTTFNEDHNDEIESDEDGHMKIDDSDVTQSSGNKRGVHKTPKNSAKSNRKFFIQFGVAVLFIMAYFVAMFILALQYIYSIQSITRELNVLAQGESYYAFIQNVQRELIYNTSKPVLGTFSYNIAKDTMKQVYTLNQLIINYHTDNAKISSDDYQLSFDQIYHENLCLQTDIIKISYIPYDCYSYINNSPIHGLQTVMIRYFERIIEAQKMLYQRFELNLDSIPLFNDPIFQELYIIQFRFIQDSFRSLMTTFTDSVNAGFSGIIDTRMAAFIVFIIGLVMSYLILWTPFVNKLNKEIWRTKSMLTIIPIEVILKIPRIQEFLHSQSFFSNKGQSQ